SLGAGAGRDSIGASLRVLKPDLGLGLDLLSEVILSPTFPPGEVTRKIGEIQASIKRSEEDPGAVAARALARLVFPGHPYGLPVEGTRESVARLTRDDVVKFHRERFRPDATVVAVVGAVTVEVRLGVLRECPDENRGGAEGPDPPQRGARAHDTRAPVRRRALAGQGVPRRELPAAPRHVREGRRLRLGDRGAGARAGLRRPLQGARCARDRPGGPARRPAVLHPRDVQQGRGRADPVRRSGIVMPALLGALLLLRPIPALSASFALTPGEREDALRVGQRSVTIETF